MNTRISEDEIKSFESMKTVVMGTKRQMDEEMLDRHREGPMMQKIMSRDDAMDVISDAKDFVFHLVDYEVLLATDCVMALVRVSEHKFMYLIWD